MGLDPSLTNFGVVVQNGELVLARLIRTSPLDRPTRAVGRADNGIFYGPLEARIDFIASRIITIWKRTLPICVGLEGYSFTKNSSAASSLHELGGVVKDRLFRKAALVDIISPSEVKLDATGKGNASKEEMIAAAIATGFTTNNDNLADAWHIARLTAKRVSA